MTNSVVLIGRLTKDPELKYSKSGVAVCGFSIAVDRGFKNAAGEKQTDFIDIVTWKKLAEIVAQNLQSGRLVAVEGRLQIRSYETQKGEKRKAAEVVADNVQFLDKPKGEVGQESEMKEEEVSW